MAATQDLAPISRAPRVLPRLLALEAGLTIGELVIVGMPIYLWAAAVGEAPVARRAAVPLAVALWLATACRLWDVLRPVATLLAAKRARLPVSAAEADAGQRALWRAPRESAVLRFVAWLLLPALILAFRRGAVTPLAVAGVLGVTAFHAAAVACVRSLCLDRVLGDFTPEILPNLAGIRVFARGWRARVVEVAVATFGLSHALLASLALAFVEMPPRALAIVSLVLWPALAITAPFWFRSLLRRTRPIADYFDATLGSAGTRGPAREEPRAVVAFVAAQALPYRMAGYQAFILATAGVLAVAVARRVVAPDFEASSAARLVAGLAAVVVAGCLYEVLVLRAMLGPLMRHLGSRHHLPVHDIRAGVGLQAKLVAVFVGASGVTAGFVALYHAAPDAAGAAPAGMLLCGLALVIGLVVLIARALVGPIKVLESRSDEMARGELARPVPPSGEADEIGRLSIAFEGMRRSLRDRLRSTESINVDLEREVRRRTEALERRNQDLREALDKLRRAQDDLVRSEKLASMGRLVAGIAHEINNPINAVINSLGPVAEALHGIAVAPTLTDAVERARGVEEMLRVVERGAGRTKSIVQALHNYSRGDETVERDVNLARSIDDSLDLLRHRLRDVRIEKDVDPTAHILGFPGQIDQVLMNLFTNAAQALGSRGGTIRVTAHFRDGDGEVELSVSDDGPGIPAEILPRIFDPFFTTKDVGEGAGLGLSIVHGIIDRHRGHIDVDSAPGRGTTFRLRFPGPGNLGTVVARGA